MYVGELHPTLKYQLNISTATLSEVRAPCTLAKIDGPSHLQTGRIHQQVEGVATRVSSRVRLLECLSSEQITLLLGNSNINHR